MPSPRRSVLLSASITDFRLSFRDYFRKNAASTSYSFPGINIGPHSPGRHIIVSSSIVGPGGTEQIDSISVNSIPLAQRVFVSNTSVSRIYTAIFSGLVPNNNMGDVVVTGNASMTACGIGVWSLYNPSSPTPADTATSTSSTVSMQCDVPSGGVLIAVAGTETSDTITWTGLTKRFQIQMNGVIAGNDHTGGDYTAINSEIDHAISAAITGVARPTGVCASWR